MTEIDIIRCWKDPAYRDSLSDAERGLVPDHPLGLIELSDSDLAELSGGALPLTYATACSKGWRCL